MFESENQAFNARGSNPCINRGRTSATKHITTQSSLKES